MNLPKTARRSLFVLAALFILLLIIVGIFLTTTSSSSLPNPNGYDDLVSAGTAITGNIKDLSSLDYTGLRDLIETNQEPLRLLHVGLSRRCAVPLEKESTNITLDLPALRYLATLAKAQGQLAEIEFRPADAARSYIDAMRIGIEISRGGTLINRLVGIACEAIGNIPFVKLLPNLSCEQLPPLIKELEKLDQNYVPWSDITHGENYFIVSELKRNHIPFKELPGLWETFNVRKSVKRKHDLTQARLRLLIVEMALHSYQCDHQIIPQNLAQLVPKYLQQIPFDPFSDNTLVYHPTGTNWLLYSIGPDQTDDGGKPLTKFVPGSGIPLAQQKGDLFYDSPL